MSDKNLQLLDKFQLDLWGRDRLCSHLLHHVLKPGFKYVCDIQDAAGNDVARFTSHKDNLLTWFDAVLPGFLDVGGHSLLVHAEHETITFGAARTYEVRNYADDLRELDEVADYTVVGSGLLWDDARTIMDAADKPERSDLVAHAEPPPPFKVICVVLYDRAYGGPEEGGWWYDTFDPDDQEAQWLTHEAGGPWLVRDDQQAQERMNWLEHQLVTGGVNAGRRDVGSVLSTGRFVAYCFDGYPLALPLEKPHYE